METIAPHLFNSQLSDRVLWYDGDSSYDPSDILNRLTRGERTNSIFTTKLTNDIKKYNTVVSKSDEIKLKEVINQFNFDWNFDPAYQQIDVDDYVLTALEYEIEGLPKKQQVERIVRTEKELMMFTQRSLVPILQLMIYIVDKFEMNDVVWGVGRGSSVSSYVLYLIGIHDIDSVKFNLSIEDFLRD